MASCMCFAFVWTFSFDMNYASKWQRFNLTADVDYSKSSISLLDPNLHISLTHSSMISREALGTHCPLTVDKIDSQRHRTLCASAPSLNMLLLRRRVFRLEPDIITKANL